MKKKNLILGGIIVVLALGNVYFLFSLNLYETRIKDLEKEKGELFTSYEKNFTGWDNCGKEYSKCAKDFNENEKIIEEIIDETLKILNQPKSSIDDIMNHSASVMDILINNKRIE